MQDALSATIALEAPARRVISLVPSVTETLFALGCADRLVGCTTFCIHPADGVARLAKVGGTKDPDLGIIRGLRPDLVLANQEENRREDVMALGQDLQVHVSYPRDIASLLAYLRDLGVLLGAQTRAEEMIGRIERARAAHEKPARPPTVLYLIWRRPWMAAAADTFIDAMLRECGMLNVAPSGTGRYPEIDLGATLDRRPDLVLLSSEPFPFGERHRVEVAQETGIPIGRVQLVSGEAFSWFGARTEGVFAEAARILSII